MTFWSYISYLCIHYCLSLTRVAWNIQIDHHWCHDTGLDRFCKDAKYQTQTHCAVDCPVGDSKHTVYSIPQTWKLVIVLNFTYNIFLILTILSSFKDFLRQHETHYLSRSKCLLSPTQYKMLNGQLWIWVLLGHHQQRNGWYHAWRPVQKHNYNRIKACQ